MGSRIRENPQHIFECFCEVVIPSASTNSPWILQKFPDDYADKEILKSVPEFACPCEFNNDTVQYFSFVLTSVDSKWTFGYSRYTPKSPTCLVLISCLPWHETFYKLLNHIVNLTNNKQAGDLSKYLEALYSKEVPDPGQELHVVYNQGKSEFVAKCPNHHLLPAIPENKNLSEYFTAINPYNMMVIFASMLQERRILITSKTLSRLSACVQAANSLIYPMHWQHIFIPVLPKHLLDYLSAPMPFLIGVPSVTMMKFNKAELGEVVILDADNNKTETPFNDLEILPYEIVSSLKRSLKNPNSLLGDGVARAFMRALVQLIGGYRSALKFEPGVNITFNPEAFVLSRPPSMQPVLEKMLHLQIFQQFIEGRLEMLNSGIGFSDEFEFEVNLYEDKASNRLRVQYKEWVINMKKEGGAFLKTVKNKANPAMRQAYKSVKDKSRRAYKDFRSKIQEIQKSNQDDISFPNKRMQPKSAPSSPTHSRSRPFTLPIGSKEIPYERENKIASGTLEGINTSLRTRRYKMLTGDDISQISEDSTSDIESSPNLNIQRIDMDLMGDLQDLIFRRCSTTNENEENTPSVALGKPPLPPKTLKPSGSSSSSLSSTNNVIFSAPPKLAPIPPPRTKRRNVTRDVISELPHLNEKSVEDAPLIYLGSIEDEQFDPLKEKQNGDVKPLPVSKVQSGLSIEANRSSLQQVGIDASRVMQPPFIPNFSYLTMAQPQQSIPPGIMCHRATSVPSLYVSSLSCSPRNPFYGHSSAELQSNNAFQKDASSTVSFSCQGQQSWTPPTLPQSLPGVFGRQTTISASDQDLLQEYGLDISALYSSPIHRPGSTPPCTSDAWTSTQVLSTVHSQPTSSNVSSSQDPFIDLLNFKENESSKKNFDVHSSWQTFQ